MTKTELPRYTDAARRIKDEMDLHAVAGDTGWAVFSLADGRPRDHVAYDSWSEAVKSTGWDRDNYFYLEIDPGGMPLGEAQAVLDYARFVRAMGGRVPPPDSHYGELFSSMPFYEHDKIRMARQLASGKPIDPRGLTNLPSERYSK